jgi:segregation and condensation protein A
LNSTLFSDSQKLKELSIKKDFQFKLSVFEGPLDLLLYLIKKDEIDIHDIPMETITQQYLEYLEIIKMLNMDLAAEFVVTAATLLYIKSKMLLPVEKRKEDEHELFDDPRNELVQKLLEYKQFKEAAFSLESLQQKQEMTFPRNAHIVEENAAPFIGAVSIFDLCQTFQDILKRAKTETPESIFSDAFTVEEKIFDLRNRLLTQSELCFKDLFGENQSKNEIICVFLAVLELIKLQEICVEQQLLFDEIVIRRRSVISIQNNTTSLF